MLTLGACAGAANDMRASEVRANDAASAGAASSGAPPSSLNGAALNGSAQSPPTLNAPALNGPTALNGPALNAIPNAAASGAAPPSGTPQGAAFGVRVEMKDPVPTAFASDLAKLGLTTGALPPIEKLDPRTLRGVMKLIAKSLGVSCTDCHEESDFGAPTARKRVSAHMWNSFAAGLAMKGGAPLFCDSCHQGRTILLDRHDPAALRGWMDREFVAKLQRIDGQEHNCETCHGAGTGDSGVPFLKTWSVL